MSINSDWNFSLLNGESIQYESPEMNAASTSQRLSFSSGQSLQLEAPAMYVNPRLQQISLSSGHPALLQTAELPFHSTFPNHASLNAQSARFDQLTNSVSMGSQHFPLTNKHLLLGNPLLKFHDAMHNSLGPLRSFSTQKQIDEMKFVPNVQGSMFLNCGDRCTPLKSKQDVHRELWPKVISAVPSNIGSHSSLSTQKGAGPSEMSTKMQKSVSGSVGFQKPSSMNKRVTQPLPSIKASTESFELVRSKMRESLTASLALDDEKNKSQSEGKYPACATLCNSETVEMKTSPGGPFARSASSSHMLEHHSKTSDCSEHNVKKHDDLQNSFSVPFTDENEKIQVSMQKHFSLKHEQAENQMCTLTDELLQGNGLNWISDPDVSKVEAKDNHDSERSKVLLETKFKDTGNCVTEKCMDHEDPQRLAVRIEAELFKLFGGVNKKYKEKGRSLLFNLKDRSNPELRKQVLSGEIAPARLCSMTAEELASKELSEWRIAKAEELAQMVVLPDSDVDLRRLVKKTHKGEFQVEIERDDSVSVEVTFGATSLLQTSKSDVDEPQHHMRPNKRKVEMLYKANGTESSSGTTTFNKIESAEQVVSNTLADFPHEKTDFMEDIIMEELKDEFLEQVPSLDEFMKDLDTEPPFKNLTDDTAREINVCSERKLESSETKTNVELASSEPTLSFAGDSLSSKKDSVVENSKLKSGDALTNSTGHTDAGSEDPEHLTVSISDELDAIHNEHDISLKVTTICSESDTPTATGAHYTDCVWEGLIQLNISSSATVLGSYKSGEKTSTSDWPSLLEIKGRVRLDAFENFLQELPLSRSRAIMILQFSWKEGSLDNGRTSLSETIDSYIADERVGYAEPARGTEIYFCPPYAKVNQILTKHLPKETEEIIMSTDNGFIGVVVWRRAHVTSTVPKKSSSHSKHNSKKHSLSREHQNLNENIVSKSRSLLGPLPMNRNKHVEEEHNYDDAPPGFGPPVARDEDDLPEFDFTHGSSDQILASKHNLSSHPSAHPVEQIRQLIHKYGHGESRNDPSIREEARSYDDDIPEWQPHDNMQSHFPLPYQQQNMGGQHLVPTEQQQQIMHLSGMHPHQQLVTFTAPRSIQLQPLQPPMVGLQQLGQWWGQPRGPTEIGHHLDMQANSYGGQLPAAGQTYNVQGVVYPRDEVEWRHGVYRNL